MDRDPLLSIRNLRVVFPTDSNNNKSNLLAVNDLSLDLYGGETLALAGESGSGKTMTALATLGLIPPPGSIASGRVLLDGQDLLTLEKDEFRRLRGNRLSIIFQDPATTLNPTTTVGGQISEAYLLHHKQSRIEARNLAIDLLAKVGINDADLIYDCYPHQLSGGMRQRAIIAMALICEPDLLIADEPTTALDTTVQAQILELLLDLQDQYGMSILFISHNFAVVSQLADNVAVMYAGKIVEILPTEDMVTSSLHPYTRGLLETMPSVERRGQILPTLMGNLSDRDRFGPGCPFSRRCALEEEICRVECPPLSSLNEKHLFACHVVAPQ